MNQDLAVISLGHRCHVASLLKHYDLRKTAYPFDNIISKFSGVIDCLETNFTTFFPIADSKEMIHVGIGKPGTDEAGNRFLFRNKYFAFTHHDMSDAKVIEAYKRRIIRFDNDLKNMTGPVIFIRTVMESDEIASYNMFENAMQTRYPNLNFLLVYIFENQNIPEGIWRENNYLVVNTVFQTQDENQSTNTRRYKYFFDILTQSNLFDSAKSIPVLPTSQHMMNDSYKGWAIIHGIYPYK